MLMIDIGVKLLMCKISIVPDNNLAGSGLPPLQ